MSDIPQEVINKIEKVFGELSELYLLVLRDYLAAKAMQGMLANPAFADRSDDVIAKWAYEQADEMLKSKLARKNHLQTNPKS